MRREAALGREVASLTQKLAETRRQLEQERRLVRHLKRELRDASLQIDVYSQLRRASGERADPIWPNTAVAAGDDTTVLAPYVVGAQTLVGAGAVNMIGKPATSVRKSPYAPRKLRHASKPSKPGRARATRPARPVILHAPRHATAPATKRRPRRAGGTVNPPVKFVVRETPFDSSTLARRIARVTTDDSLRQNRAHRARHRRRNEAAHRARGAGHHIHQGRCATPGAQAPDPRGASSVVTRAIGSAEPAATLFGPAAAPCGLPPPRQLLQSGRPARRLRRRLRGPLTSQPLRFAFESCLPVAPAPPHRRMCKSACALASQPAWR